jgi:putative selenate reductase
MSDKFEPVELNLMLGIILKEYRKNNSIFGIPSELFYNPERNSHLRSSVFDQVIDNPIGVAAGPHTQLAQNIAAAWLMGARYIELKTIQTLDELEVAKPCIDMQDEGYNCEWSQELKIHESFNEYLNAWIIIHLLHHKLGFKSRLNTVFNMSVGYNMEGILNSNVQWFFEKMQDCRSELKEKIKEIKEIYPEIEEIQIPAKISDNITLSTMHGCPANEIEQIAEYLLKVKKLHTLVKLNPTLLGPELLRNILNKKLNFKTIVPDIAFEHDLKYNDALKIIKNLQKTAKTCNLIFGLKLTNTLESVNNKSIFDSEIEMMYMSGRALHPVSVNLAKKLRDGLEGEISLSFSGGIDAFNISDTLACGFKTITMCTDLLKPGGYMRLNQYFEEIEKDFRNLHSHSVKEFIITTAGLPDLKSAQQKNLSDYASFLLDSGKYQRTSIKPPDIKTPRQLSYFDCITAPCQDTCSTHQDIPNYLYYSSLGDFNKAFEIILETNPFPSITGMICDHLCQYKCTRVNYDDPVLIREVKRFISEQDQVELKPISNNGLKVAVIGAGPSGLASSYYLALAGFSVEVFEKNTRAGGMVQYAIPGFRLTDEAINKDFKRVTDLGVKIYFNSKIDNSSFKNIQKDHDFLFLAAGAQLSMELDIEGHDLSGVMEPLNFLFNVKKGEISEFGKNVVIIGGGNTAMDAARTAYRLVGKEGKVTIVYRRTINEMPADHGEIKAVLEEGMEIIELTAPEKIISDNGKVKALVCSRMNLIGKDGSGRPKPVKIPDSEFEIPCDIIIPAIGQKKDIDFLPEELNFASLNSYQTEIDKLFIGGDALRGASTAINAIGDGRKVAELIIKKSGINSSTESDKVAKNISIRDLILKRAKRIPAPKLKESPIDTRKTFEQVSYTLDKQTVINEADRCMYCDEICNICTTVCPNFANYSYEIEPVKYQLQKIVKNENGDFDIIDDNIFIVNQKFQILNIANFCNECGNCTTFCPTNSAPYKEKPKIHLTRESFNKNLEGYYFEKTEKGNKLLNKDINIFHNILLSDNKYIYETNDCYCEFETEDFSILDFKAKDNEITEFNFRKAAEMSIIMQGISDLLFQ